MHTKGLLHAYYLQMAYFLRLPCRYLDYKNIVSYNLHIEFKIVICKILNFFRLISFIHHQKKFCSVYISYFDQIYNEPILFLYRIQLPSSRLARSCNWDFVTPFILTVMLASTAQNSFHWHRQVDNHTQSIHCVIMFSKFDNTLVEKNHFQNIECPKRIQLLSKT